MSHSSPPFHDSADSRRAIALSQMLSRQHRDPKGLWWVLAGLSLAAHGGMAIATQDWMARLKEPPVTDQPIPIEWVELPPAALTEGSGSDATAEDSPSSPPETLAPAPAASPRSSSSSESSIAINPLRTQTPPETSPEMIETAPTAPSNASNPPEDADVEAETGSTDSTDIATNSDGISGGEGDGLQQIRDGDAPPLPGNLGSLADNSGVPVDAIDPSNLQTIPTEPIPTEFQITLWVEPLPTDQPESEISQINSTQFKAVDEQVVHHQLTQTKQDQAPSSPDEPAEELPEQPASSTPEPNPSTPAPSQGEPSPPDPVQSEPPPASTPQPEPSPVPELPPSEPALLPEPLDFERSFVADPTQSECDAVSDVDPDLGRTESFKVQVDAEGEVISTEPMEENVSDYQAFAQCLIQEWPFEPATRNGEAVESETFLAHITITVEPPAQ